MHTRVRTYTHAHVHTRVHICTHMCAHMHARRTHVFHGREAYQRGAPARTAPQSTRESESGTGARNLREAPCHRLGRARGACGKGKQEPQRPTVYTAGTASTGSTGFKPENSEERAQATTGRAAWARVGP